MVVVVVVVVVAVDVVALIVFLHLLLLLQPVLLLYRDFEHLQPIIALQRVSLAGLNSPPKVRRSRSLYVRMTRVVLDAAETT